MFENILELSTSHIEQSDTTLLSNEQHFTVAEYEEGFFIYTPSDVDCEESNIEDYSESFKKLIEYARKQNCRFICLDRDADTCQKLKINEW